MLSDIYLHNFKCFENVHIELSNLNVFAGINSMGKSTVIQSILLLRQAYETNTISSGLPLNGELINLGSGYDVLFRDSNDDFFSICLKIQNKEFVWKYNYDNEADFQILCSEQIADKDLKHINIFSSTFSYISADRIGPKPFYTKSYHRVYNMNQVGYHGELFADYLAEKGYDEHVLNTNILYPNIENTALIYQFEAWISEISPGISASPKKYKEAGIVSIGYSVDGKEHTPLNVGFGISYTAPIVLSLLKAKKGDLVILENPEAHLHPRGQRIIGELISKACSGGVQVIVETHSDHLLNGIRLSVKKNIIDRCNVRLNYFYQEIDENNKSLQNKVVHKKCSPSILDDGSLSEWPDGFFDEWDKALDSLF